VDISSKRAIIQLRLKKAHEDLDTAQDLLKLSRWRGAVNRAYYTVFHAASAMLLWLGIERAKHAGVQAAFNEFLIKPGLIEKEFGRIFRVTRESREEQDYSISTREMDETIATQFVRDAERFITRSEQYLRQEGAIE
jgi:uncharacterized protein (UPF0332 family)